MHIYDLVSKIYHIFDSCFSFFPSLLESLLEVFDSLPILLLYDFGSLHLFLGNPLYPQYLHFCHYVLGLPNCIALLLDAMDDILNFHYLWVGVASV